MRAARLIHVLTVAAALSLSAVAFAQFGRGEFGNIPPRYMPRELPDRKRTSAQLLEDLTPGRVAQCLERRLLVGGH